MKLAAILLVLGTPLALLAQSPAVRVSVPFVGCASDGQIGHKEAPKGKAKSVHITATAAKQLAWYESAAGAGVLAPRGWHCFRTYGSGGDTLMVSAQSIDTAQIFSTDYHLSGPAITISHNLGDTSGRDGVAEVIARVFPSFKFFVAEVEKDPMGHGSFTAGPYPDDTLTYKNNSMVEYQTPAGVEGLGTGGWLEKSDTPIDGVAMLTGKTPDLLLLAVRLPAALNRLTPEIIHQFESDNPPAGQ